MLCAVIRRRCVGGPDEVGAAHNQAAAMRGWTDAFEGCQESLHVRCHFDPRLNPATAWRDRFESRHIQNPKGRIPGNVGILYIPHGGGGGIFKLSS